MGKAGAVFAAFLLVVSVAVAILFALIASDRPLTSLESVLLQALSLLAGLSGSFYFGRISAKSLAKELIKPHARSAFRRVLSLYQGLSRLAQAVARAERASQQSHGASSAGYETLKAIVVEQIATAGDALEDWRDVVPDDVAEVEQRVAHADSGADELERIVEGGD